LRLNRMKPQGRSARRKSRSEAVSSGPDTPVMNARLGIGRVCLQPARGSRKARSIALDDALPAGSPEIGAELRGLVAGGERPDRVLPAVRSQRERPIGACIGR